MNNSNSNSNRREGRTGKGKEKEGGRKEVEGRGRGKRAMEQLSGLLCTSLLAKRLTKIISLSSLILRTAPQSSSYHPHFSEKESETPRS